MAAVGFGHATNRLIPCEIEQLEGISRRVGSREEEWGREEGSGHLVCARIGEARRQRLQVFDEKSVDLERIFAREKERRRSRGSLGLYRRGLAYWRG
jgi:hypothetical protein